MTEPEMKTAAIPANATISAGDNQARFKDAMSRVAATVHVVTTDGKAGLGGITASAVTSITIEPPMMLFCINKTSPSAQRMIENGVFCINTLAPPHEAIANVFAGRTDQHLAERFSSGEWAKLTTGSPVLASAVAAFDCKLIEAKEVSTHFVMIGEVVATEYGPEGGETLGYVHRKYKAF